MLKERLSVLVILVAVPILYFVFESKITFDKGRIDSAILIVATFIVTMTIYYLLSILMIRYPRFMIGGLRRHPFIILVLGTIGLMILMFGFSWLSSQVDSGALFYQVIFYSLAYPVVFILIVMIDAFLSKIISVNRQKRLFYSSISISICLTIMIFSTLLGNL